MEAVQSFPAESFLSDMALADMASKVHLLQSLSSFLSCVASPTSLAAEENSISAWLGTSVVSLQRVEISQLHEVLFQELESHTSFLSASFRQRENEQLEQGVDGLTSFLSTSFRERENEQLEQGGDGLVSRTLHVEILSQTLRCCIRILPLLDCFDKSVGQSSARFLDGVLQQLCSPTRLLNLLQNIAANGNRFQHSHCSGRSCYTAQDCEDETWFETTVPNNGEESIDNLAIKDSRDVVDIIYAMLEVYMDELLLRPHLSSRLLSSRDHMHWLMTKEQVTSCDTHTEAPLDAAFVHALLSLYAGPVTHGSDTARRKEFALCNLSLPAGLILLEKFRGDEVPTFYIAHVVRLVARILNDATPLNCEQVDELTSTVENVERKSLVGGVDWSYCIQERLPNCDLMDWRLNTESLDSGSTLEFASSIFERALVLYMRICASPGPLSTSEDSTSSTLYQTLQGPLLKSYLSKYTPLFNILTKTLELNLAHIHGETGDGEGTDEVYVLVAALLQLMSCSLECIGREVCKLTRLPHASDHQFLKEHAMSLAELNGGDFDHILRSVSLNLSLCIPVGASLNSNFHLQQCIPVRQSKLNVEPIFDGGRHLGQLVGEAILYFASILRIEVQRGAPDGLLKKYFHLVESLVALLLSLDKRNNSMLSSTGLGSRSKCTLSENICRTSLEAVVLALQAMLQDLSNQQRSGLGFCEPKSVPDESRPASSLASVLIAQSSVVEVNEARTDESQQTPVVKNVSPTTYAIIKRLLHQPPLKKKAVKSSCNIVSIRSSNNSFVDTLSAEDPSKENYDDLKDFIVSKRGRDYSVWLKRRKKSRRILYNKNLFRRLQERTDLLQLLD